MTPPMTDARRHRETQATALFLGTALIAALTVGALRVSGWGGGVLDNRIEPLFWAGAILAGVAIGLFALAAAPRPRMPDDRAAAWMARLITVGLALFVVGPILSVVAVFTDYWI
jgi:hypothetical protein